MVINFYRQFVKWMCEKCVALVLPCLSRKTITAETYKINLVNECIQYMCVCVLCIYVFICVCVSFQNIYVITANKLVICEVISSIKWWVINVVSVNGILNGANICTHWSIESLFVEQLRLIQQGNWLVLCETRMSYIQRQNSRDLFNWYKILNTFAHTKTICKL